MELRRIRSGNSNTVFEATLASGTRVIVRARTGTHRYGMEERVMGWARQRGVPAPEVHAILPRGLWTVMVMERRPGVPLDEAVDVGQPIVRQCAELLAAIHSVPVAGFGNLDADGRGARETFEQWFVDDLEAALSASRCDAVARAEVERILHRLDRARPLLREAAGGLAHGDFRPANILVDGEAVTGIIDWESAKGGPPWLDFGWWDWASTRRPAPFTTEELLAQYVSVRPLDADEVAEGRELVGLRVTAASLL